MSEPTGQGRLPADQRTGSGSKARVVASGTVLPFVASPPVALLRTGTTGTTGTLTRGQASVLALPTVAPMPRAVFKLESLMLQHPLHKAGKEKLVRLHARSASRLAGDATPPAGMLVLGDSRMGKTWLFRDYAAAFPIVTKASVEQGGPRLPDGLRWSLEDGDYRPIVQCSVPSNGDLRSVMCSLLAGFGYSARETWNTTNMVAQIAWYVRAMGTQMIFIDEGHNLFSKRDDLTTAEVVEFLKQLLNDVPCEIVIAGLPELKGITKFAPQLRGRMEPPVHMRAYRWASAAGKRNYVGLLRRFEQEFDLPQPSNIHHFDLARRMYVASIDGRIGWVVKLLSLALRQAIEEGRPRIDLEVLGRVYADFEYDEEDEAKASQATKKGVAAKVPEPDFLDEKAFNEALADQQATLAAPTLPTELNPFLCDERHLSVIRAGLIQRVDLEKQALARVIEDATRTTRLRPKPERAVTAFGGR